MKNNETICMVCGEPLKELDAPQVMQCFYCGAEVSAAICCTNGHYVCPDCYASPVAASITYLCLHSASRNPLELTKEMLRLPNISLKKIDRYILLGSALLTAYRNSGGAINLERALDSLWLHSSKLLQGIKNSPGSCLAAMAAGVFLAIAMGGTPHDGENRSLGMQLTASCLSAIAKVSGPRCLNREMYLALQTTVKFIAENLSVVMELPEKIVCAFFKENDDCQTTACPFFP